MELHRVKRRWLPPDRDAGSPPLLTGGGRTTMTKNNQGKTAGEIRILLVGVRREEREALVRSLAPREPRFSLLAVSSLAEALSYAETPQADAIVCDLSALAALREALAGNTLDSRPVPILVLVPPGGEERAAALLERESVEFVLQAGNYQVLLPALLRRVLRRRETSWEEVAMVIRHEINNPLTGILGNAELILAEGITLPDKVRDRLATIINLAVRLRDVLKNLEARLHPNSAPPPGSLPAEPAPPLPLTREGIR